MKDKKSKILANLDMKDFIRSEKKIISDEWINVISYGKHTMIATDKSRAKIKKIIYLLFGILLLICNIVTISVIMTTKVKWYAISTVFLFFYGITYIIYGINTTRRISMNAYFVKQKRQVNVTPKGELLPTTYGSWFNKFSGIITIFSIFIIAANCAASIDCISNKTNMAIMGMISDLINLLTYAAIIAMRFDNDEDLYDKYYFEYNGITLRCNKDLSQLEEVKNDK